MKVRDLLDSKSKWTKGAMARDNEGRNLSLVNTTVAETVNDSQACCWCLYGAIVKCYPEDCGKVLDKLLVTLPDGPVWYNDARDRTFEEVKQLVESLDI